MVLTMGKQFFQIYPWISIQKNFHYFSQTWKNMLLHIIKKEIWKNCFYVVNNFFSQKWFWPWENTLVHIVSPSSHLCLWIIPTSISKVVHDQSISPSTLIPRMSKNEFWIYLSEQDNSLHILLKSLEVSLFLNSFCAWGGSLFSQNRSPSSLRSQFCA